MDNNKTKKLCLSLLHADTEEEVISILKNSGYWDQPTAWRLYGDKEGNYSVAGSQQAQPEAALVEKIVNSVDASLTNECLTRGINPESSAAPDSIQQAVAKFYEDRDYEGEYGGVLKEWNRTKRLEVAKKITLTATGSKKSTCLTIVDVGEGQSPNRIPETILSLNKKNKQRVRFVQGKFNMGGTGVLRHCGKHSFQLIISKRNPKIVDAMNEDDGSSKYWSFTIVRRDRPTGKAGDVVNSEFKYLAPTNDDDKGGVLRFLSDDLPLMPEGNDPYTKKISWGTAIKLYNFDLSAGSSHILRPRGLLNRLDVLLPEIALPIRLFECRPNIRGREARSNANNLTGLAVRLHGNENIEVEPWDVPFVVRGLKFTANIYVFKSGKTKTYLRNEGVIFSINGQSHGFIPRTIYNRTKVGLNRLGKDLMVMVDCSSIPVDAREDLFMSSRDRLSKGELRNAVETQLEEILRTDSKLKEIQNARKDEEIAERLAEQKPLTEVLQNILKSSPTLSTLFLRGQRISMPKNKGSQVSSGHGGVDGEGDQPGTSNGANEFIGNPHPTYFRFSKAPSKMEYHRNCEQGRIVRVEFETDVENGYFTRHDNRGRYELELVSGDVDKEKISHSLNLHDGAAQWSISIPKDIAIGEELIFRCIINDDVILNPIISTLKLSVKAFKDSNGRAGKKKLQKSGKVGSQPSLSTGGMNEPHVIKVKKDSSHWKKHEFDEKSACAAIGDVKEESGKKESEYTFYVNVDNMYLHHEMKFAKEPELVEAKYVYGNVLLGLALIHDHENSASQKDNEISIDDYVKNVTRAIAPFLVPMINYLGGLNAEEVSSLGETGDEE